MNAPIVQLAGHRRNHGGDGGSIPTLALQHIVVSPISAYIARPLIVQCHYIHAWPGGTKLTFGIFAQKRLMGALTLGVGPPNAHRLVAGASRSDCIVLTRFFLDDQLPRNSASRVLGISLRALKKNTDLKFVVSYADPAFGHSGVIYRASNWTFSGWSQATTLYDFGDGIARHPRTVGASLGTRSAAHVRKMGLAPSLILQPRKLRFIFFLDPTWRQLLKSPHYPHQRSEA